MKTRITVMLLALLLLTMIGCGKEPDRNTPQSKVPSTPNTTQGNTGVPPASPSAKEAQPAGDTVSKQVIRISDGKNAVTFQLNNSKAAKDLYNQLPLTIQVQNYSTNEKIFYPAAALDTNNAPEASGKVGSLAYYEPWGNVVMFYKPFSPSPGGRLYELGQAVSGSGDIQNLTGTIAVSKE